MTDEVREFTGKALRLLGTELQPLGEDRFVVDVPDAARERLEGRERLYLTFHKEVFQKADESDLEFVTNGAPVLTWLIEEVRALGSVSQARGGDWHTPEDRLFGLIASRYRVADGESTPDACEAREQHRVWLEYRLTLHATETRERLFQIVVDDRGEQVDRDVARALLQSELHAVDAPFDVELSMIEKVLRTADQAIELHVQQEKDKLLARVDRKRHEEEQQLDAYFAGIRGEIEGYLEGVSDPTEREDVNEQLAAVDQEYRLRKEELDERYRCRVDVRLVNAIILATRTIRGTIRLESNGAIARVEFEVPSDKLEPPPFVCPVSGRETFSIAFCSSGTLVAAEELAPCAVSGRPYARAHLRECSGTGRTVHPDHLATCDVSGLPVLPEAMTECSECHQRCSPIAVESDTCEACRNRKPVDCSDPDITRAYDRYPKLADWRHVDVAVTPGLFNFALRGIFGRGLLVLDRESLAPRYAAKGSVIGSLKPVDVSALLE
jgi:hypothetical protein